MKQYRGERTRRSSLPWTWQETEEKLFVVRKVKRTKNGSTTTYELQAVTTMHSALVLLKGLDSLGQGLWLEQEIERRLGIRNEPVAGEYRG